MVPASTGPGGSPSIAYMLHDAALAVPAETSDVLAWALRGIGEPGTWLTSRQRLGVATEARASLAGTPGPDAPISDELAEVAQAVAEAPGDITPDWIDDLESRGLDRFSYVEACGVVCRMSVIDTFTFGVGATPPPLPPPRDGEPSRRPVAGATRSRAWVPVVGPGGAMTSLSAVEGEHESMQRLSDVLYLSDVVPVTKSPKGGLVRSQIEVLAARASFLNDCFY